MIAMAHYRLEPAGPAFALHYFGAAHTRADLAFGREITAPFGPRARCVHSAIRASTGRLFMRSVRSPQGQPPAYALRHASIYGGAMAAATYAGFAEDQLHIEYIRRPRGPPRENHKFSRSGSG